MPIDLNDLQDSGTQQPPVEVETAFLVIIRGKGVIQASMDINVPITVQREATVDEMEMAAHKIAADIQATKTAQVTQQNIQQAASQAMQQADAQRLAQNLNL